MKNFTLIRLASRTTTFRTIIGSLALLLLCWLPACSLLQKSEPLTHSISEEEYLGLCFEHGLYPHRSPDVPHTPIPFKTVAEASVYVEELAKFVHHQSDGKALYQLELRYPAPLTLEQQTSLRLLELRSKEDVFAGSNYQGHRYAVTNPNNPQAEPQILEVILDRKSQVLIEPGNDAVPRCLYTSLTTGAKVACNFTGYAYLYTSKYHRTKGKAYLNGQVFAENISLEARYNGSLNSITGKAPANGKTKLPATTASATTSNAECVHWIDYYASDGTYITTVCLDYSTGGGPWGGGGGGPVNMPDDGDGGGGGGGSGGSGGGGSGPISLPTDPNDVNGIAVITQPYGFLPGQNVQVTLQYSHAVINYFDSNLTGAEGVAQWIHKVGDQRNFADGTFTFDIAFAVNKILPIGYVVMYGSTHIMSGTYSVRTSAGYLAVPKYWE